MTVKYCWQEKAVRNRKKKKNANESMRLKL